MHHHLHAPTEVLEGAGVRLRRSFPTPRLDRLDPFLLLDDFSSQDPDDYRMGFPWHPHRGIETVTYVLAGRVDHRDSLGNAGSIGPGEAQWMTAGSGIMHEEMPDPGSGPLLGFQLWINLPAREKMTAPRYRDLRAAAIPVLALGAGVTLRVIAGRVDGVAGPVAGLSTEPLYLDAELAPGADARHAMPAGSRALAYCFQGGASFSWRDGEIEALAAPAMIDLGQSDRLTVRAGERGARYLLISGRPLGEPVARYGPFVMNTREEIDEALRDLRQGTFIRRQPETDPQNRYGAGLRDS